MSGANTPERLREALRDLGAKLMERDQDTAEGAFMLAEYATDAELQAHCDQIAAEGRL